MRRNATDPARHARLLPPLLLLLALLLGGCAAKQVEAPPAHAPGSVMLPDGRSLTDAELARLMAASDYVLVGERHDNAVDHEVQARLLRLSAERGQRPLLGLEMLPHGRSEAQLKAFSQGRLSLEDLPSAVDWQRAWGFDFALYRPVFAEARRHGIAVYGINIPNDLRKRVSGKGMRGLSAADRAALPDPIVLPLPEQREKLSAFFLQHSAMLAGGKAARPSRRDSARPAAKSATPEVPVLPVSVPGTRHGRPASVVIPISLRGHLERFLLIQSLWDGTMAEQAGKLRAQAGPGRPVFILAGSGHVEYGYGIAYRLRLLEPQARILTIMPFSGEKPEAGEADVFFYSPPSAPSGYGIVFDRRGKELFIKAVLPNSRAEKAGLKAGDRIVRAGGSPLQSPVDLHKAAQDARQRRAPLELAVEREGRELAVTLR